jgi:hypothetical protein
MLFNCDLTAPLLRAKHKQMISDAIIRMLETPENARHRSGL